MKTIVACLLLVVLALVVGRNQRVRLRELRAQAPPETGAPVTKLPRESGARFYENRYRPSPGNRRAEDALAALRTIRENRDRTKGWMVGGPVADIAERNPQAFQAIMQLDLAELERLRGILHDLPYHEFGMSKGQWITLCLAAIAHHDAELAIDHVMPCARIPVRERLNGLNDLSPGLLLEYMFAHWAHYDSLGALLKATAVLRELPDIMERDARNALFSKFARRHPLDVLKGISGLPKAMQSEIRTTLPRRLETNEERTALFRATRALQPADSQAARETISSLVEQLAHSSSLPAAIRWLESLEMTDSEKLLLKDSLIRLSKRAENGEEYWQWMASFLGRGAMKGRVE